MKYFLLVLFLITGTEFGVFYHYNSILENKGTTVSEKPKMKNGKMTLVANEIVQLISISDNHQLAAYVNENNELHVINMTTHENIYSTADENKIVYLKWIGNDSLFIGVKSGENALTLKTYTIGSQPERTIMTFSPVTNTSTFKSIVYSPYTNDVYTLIGNDNISRMYHFDTNGTFTPVPLYQNYIERPMMLSTVNQLFYSDEKHTIWKRENRLVNMELTNSVPLAVYDDLFYFGELNGEGKVIGVSVMNKGQVRKVIDLPNPEDIDSLAVTKGGSVLLINSNTYYNYSKKKTYSLPNNEVIKVDNNNLFVTVDNKTYLLQP